MKFSREADFLTIKYCTICKKVRTLQAESVKRINMKIFRALRAGLAMLLFVIPSAADAQGSGRLALGQAGVLAQQAQSA